MIEGYRRILMSAAFIAMQAGAQSSQQAQSDDSPHRAQFIKVDQDVELEVLDWGGSGRPVVLLAGLGLTAHSYDSFAPGLSGHFRVYGITRRGFGRSSKPAIGYSIPRLSEDVLVVMDALKLDAPLVIGHSVAGQELDELGAKHSQRIAGLIYLDAAGDRTEPTPEEYVTLARFVMPNAPGVDMSLARRPASMQGLSPSEQIFYSVQKPDYKRIAVPALSVFAVPREPRGWYPNYDKVDAGKQKAYDRMHELNVANMYRQNERFDREIARSKTVPLLGAQHNIFRSNPDDVMREILDFAARELR